MKITSEAVKRFAKECGADLCGIGSMDRWEGAPGKRDPRYVFPEAKSCLSLAFRIPRGYLRGTEEGTLFSTYTSMGYAGINAFICGLGQFGWSKLFLTPEFGPLQRFVSLLTDAELEPDPIFEGKLCDRCMCCARGCTGGAISTTESDTCRVAGHEIEFAKIDLGKCSSAYRGGNPHYNPFLPKDFTDYDALKSLSWPGFADLVGIPLYQRHACAIEGARGCMRECYIHLEKTGRLKRKFTSPFRKRKPWRIELDGGEHAVEGSAEGPDENVLL